MGPSNKYWFKSWDNERSDNLPFSFYKWFFVSGAGGGLTKVDGIPNDMCSAPDVKSILLKNRYTLDFRVKPSGVSSFDELFNNLEEMLLKRITSFIELCTVFRTDFSFLVLRAPAVLMYLATYNILHKSADDAICKKIQNFFKILDENIEKLFNTLQPENFIITSDHGMAPQKYHVNYNSYLADIGYLEKNTP